MSAHPGVGPSRGSLGDDGVFVDNNPADRTADAALAVAEDFGALVYHGPPAVLVETAGEFTLAGVADADNAWPAWGVGGVLAECGRGQGQGGGGKSSRSEVHFGNQGVYIWIR